jgi:hypothetical protein
MRPYSQIDVNFKQNALQVACLREFDNALSPARRDHLPRDVGFAAQEYNRAAAIPFDAHGIGVMRIVALAHQVSASPAFISSHRAFPS